MASFSFPGAAIPSIFDVNAWTLLLYLFAITAETFLFTFLFLKTNESVFIAILFHAVFNASSNIILTIFPQIADNIGQREVIYILNIAFIALLGFVLLLRQNNISKNKT
ncbi:hypothetical protein ACFL4B_02685 [Candidatus Neomarinimicrobiota bacterium]